MNLIISGPQGSGKGTQGELLAEKYGMFHLESGSILRQVSKEKTELGRKVADYLNAGTIVPDDITNELIMSKLTQENLDKGIVFDGFPRRLTQVSWLEVELGKRGAQIDRMILLNISEETSVNRLMARRLCPKCGRNFNLVTMPPRNGEVCDDCNITLIRRADETPETISNRLENYRKETAPLIDYYREKGKVIDINGEVSPPAVFESIVRALDDSH